MKRRYGVFRGKELCYISGQLEDAERYRNRQIDKNMCLIMHKNLGGDNPTHLGEWIYWRTY